MKRKRRKLPWQTAILPSMVLEKGGKFLIMRVCGNAKRRLIRGKKKKEQAHLARACPASPVKWGKAVVPSYIKQPPPPKGKQGPTCIRKQTSLDAK